MRITKITLWQVGLTSHDAYYMADGKACETVTTTVLRLTTDSGLEGWGESCPIPHYLPAFADGIPGVVEHLSPLILGADVTGPEALMARLDAHLPGHEYAKSAIDIALWDLWAKAVGQPLYSLLGGRRVQSAPIYHSLTCVTPEEMARMAREAYAKGIRQFQVKLGSDADWQADVARLMQVREAVGEGPIVYGDWNCGSTQLDATRVGRAVAHLDIMLEQPCATLDQCASVRSATGLPMKIDENAHDTASLLKAADLGCMDAVALKLSKFGGLTPLKKARDLCEYLGVKMCIECTWGSDISTAASVHLGVATDPKYAMNICDLSRYVYPRIAPDGPEHVEGKIAPADAPGLGVTPDLDILGTPVAEHA